MKTIFLESIKKFMKRKKYDIIILFSLLIVSSVVCINFMKYWGGTPDFYQESFAPSVMFACGKGLNNVDINSVPGLKDFLMLKTGLYSCDQIPNELSIVDMDKFQSASRYLLYAVASVWSFLEISWDSLLLLYTILFNITILSCYFIARAWMNKILSVLAALFIAFAPIHLTYLPHLRDYSKAPFILFSIALIAYLIKYPANRVRIYILSGIIGAVLGIGIGFRMDLLIFMPLMLFSILFMVKVTHQRIIITKLSSTLLLCLVFVLIAFPILSELSSGGNTFHVIILGFTSWFDPKLGVIPSPLYNWGYLYNDGYIYSTLQSYSDRVFGNGHVGYASSEYEEIGLHYFIEIAKNFPADMISRLVAAIIQVLQIPFANGWNLPVQLSSHLLFKFSGIKNPIAFIDSAPIIIAVVSIILVSFSNIRYGIATIIFIVYLCGYPVLQFDPRHYFHLEIINVCFTGFIIQQTISILFKIKKNNPFEESRITILNIISNNKKIISHVLVLLGITITWIAIFYGLRLYQANHVDQFINNYSNARMTKLDMTTTRLPDGDVLFSSQEVGKPSGIGHDQAMNTDYIVLEFERDSNFNSRPFSVEMLYESDVSFNNYSRTITVDLRNSLSRRVYHPVYSSTWSKFKGIVIDERYWGNLKAVYKFNDIKPFKLLLDLNLSDHWKSERKYQVIGTKKTYTAIHGVNVYGYPSYMDLYNQEINRPFYSDDITFRDSNLTLHDHDWELDGRFNQHYNYLITFRNEFKEPGTLLIVKGELLDGGFQFGVLKNKQWDSYVLVDKKGEFEIVIELQKSGEYVPIFANYLNKVPDNTNFTISEIGWYEE